MRAEPRQVAAGVAVGVFIGVFPTFGMGILLTILLARFWHFHVPAALLAGTLSIAPPLGTCWILLCAWTGGIRPQIIQHMSWTWMSVTSLGGEVVVRYLLGCTIVSTGAAIVSYLLVLLSANLFGARPAASSLGRK